MGVVGACRQSYAEAQCAKLEHYLYEKFEYGLLVRRSGQGKFNWQRLSRDTERFFFCDLQRRPIASGRGRATIIANKADFCFPLSSSLDWHLIAPVQPTLTKPDIVGGNCSIIYLTRLLPVGWQIPSPQSSSPRLTMIAALMTGTALVPYSSSALPLHPFVLSIEKQPGCSP
jgi:hypothetical protein